MNRLRTRLIAAFLLATVVPLGLTLWTTLLLVDRSLQLAPLSELRSVTQSLELTGRELSQQARESLRRDVADGRITPTIAPDEVLQASEDEAFALTGERGDELHYYVRRGGQVL